ncbi:hypothetical protein CATMQ487_02230 [Sphaerotilus microaerophilus]|uniref:HTH lysR-type domain-containing protein n=1 Tax=Sphaerotilus microaerophilus TaxID=2914710 RepID=A0ABM7YGF1_9BURK|nr:hypothetical protein CATMQ487_02230 [Sphaerotilus sp. FB-5]
MTQPALQSADLAFLVSLAGSGSLSAAARELGLSKAAVSKRLALIESRSGVALVNRSTRRMSLTPEGEAVVERARRILGEIEELDALRHAKGAAGAGRPRLHRHPPGRRGLRHLAAVDRPGRAPTQRDGEDARQPGHQRR